MEPIYTVEEWKAFEKNATLRHEFVFGKITPIAAGTKRANIIAGNIKKSMDDPLYEKGFQIYDHDVKAEVIQDGIYRYPNLVVAPIVDDEDEYIVKHPVFLAEVASEDSVNRDRVKKRRQYLEIPSLWYYLIVSQDEMWAELHLRNENGTWETIYFTEPSDEIELQRFDLKISLSDIYKRIKVNI